MVVTARQQAESDQSKHRRRVARAAEAFQRRAESAERRWLAGLVVGGTVSSRAPFPRRNDESS